MIHSLIFLFVGRFHVQLEHLFCLFTRLQADRICLYPKKLTRTSRLSIRCFVNISLHMRGLNKITKFLENPLIKNNVIKRKEGN